MKKILAFLASCQTAVCLGQQLISVQNDSIRIEIEKLQDAVNSAFNDYAPVITADGSELYFTSRRPVSEKEKKKNAEGKEAIYFSNYNEETKTWSLAALLNENVNVPGRFNSNIAISNDGQRLLIYQDDVNGNGDIFEANREGHEWSKPAPLSEMVNTDYHESSASIAPDGRTIYFVSERIGGNGKRDIWYCTKELSGKWSVPQNLGKVINTKEDEESVFIHPDGKTLYFSSKGHASIGGYDVFVSKLEKGKWSKPIALPTPINTEGDDLFFVLRADGQTGYYASSRDADQKDIYEIRFIPITAEKVQQQPKLTVIKGIIRDELTKAPIEAKIQLIDNEENKVISEFKSNSATGKFLVSLPAGKNYGISVTASNYLFHSENVDIPDTSNYQEINRDIDLKKLTKGTQIILRNIFFDLDKYTLKPASKTELERLQKLMVENPNLIIEISGHTDTQGSAEYNQQLSENRAKTVVEYLVAAGLDRSRFTFKGYGEAMPLISDEKIQKMKNQQEKDKANAYNRRTEFKILSN